MATMTTIKPKSYRMLHPTKEVPTEAVQVGYWMDGGRVRGLELQFPGESGTRHLAFAEIGDLQDALDEYEDETQQ